MKTKNAAWCLFGLMSFGVQANVGKLMVNSPLDAPFAARIVLADAKDQKLAKRGQVAVEGPHQLTFNVLEIDKKVVLDIQSNEAIHEPTLTFSVRVGKEKQSYTAILDPVEYERLPAPLNDAQGVDKKEQVMPTGEITFAKPAPVAAPVKLESVKIELSKLEPKLFKVEPVQVVPKVQVAPSVKLEPVKPTPKLEPKPVQPVKAEPSNIAPPKLETPAKPVQVASQVNGVLLADILKYALEHDPQILEAEGNLQSAHGRKRIAQAAHLPVISAYARGGKQQQQGVSSKQKLAPGLALTWNVFAFGALQKGVESAKALEQGSTYRLDEARENVAYTATETYLKAIRYFEASKALEIAAAEVEKTIKQIDVIAKHDSGRRSEFIQATSRRLALKQQEENTRRELENALLILSRLAGRDVKAGDLRDPFSRVVLSRLAENYASPKEEHPSLKTRLADAASIRAQIGEQKAKQLPKIDLIGQAAKGERGVFLNLSWDVFNLGNRYGTQEKAGELAAADSLSERVLQELQEREKRALIDIRQYRQHLQTLLEQIRSQEEVVRFYQLQFSIAKRSLLEVLNAQSELSNATLARIESAYGLRHAVLDYLYAQGALARFFELNEH